MVCSLLPMSMAANTAGLSAAAASNLSRSPAISTGVFSSNSLSKCAAFTALVAGLNGCRCDKESVSDTSTISSVSSSATVTASKTAPKRKPEVTTIAVYTKDGKPVVKKSHQDPDVGDISSEEIKLVRDLAKKNGYAIKDVTVSIGDSGQKDYYELAARSLASFLTLYIEGRSTPLYPSREEFHNERSKRGHEFVLALVENPSVLPRALTESDDVKNLIKVASPHRDTNVCEVHGIPLVFLENVAGIVGAIETCRVTPQDCDPRKLRTSFVGALDCWVSVRKLPLFEGYLRQQASLLPPGEAASSLQLAAGFLPWVDIVTPPNPWEGLVVNEDAKLRQHMADFRRQVFADGSLDPWEREFIQGLKDELKSYVGLSSLVATPLSLMLHPDFMRRDPFTNRFLTVADAVTGYSYSFLVNRGIGVGSEEEQRMIREAGGLTEDSVEIINRKIEERSGMVYLNDKEKEDFCSKEKICDSTIGFHPNALYLEWNYRMVDPTKEFVRRGDLLAYVSIDLTQKRSESDHLLSFKSPRFNMNEGRSLFVTPGYISRILAVSAAGVPTRAVNKFNEEIVIHDPDRFPLSCGILAAVFRKKTD